MCRVFVENRPALPGGRTDGHGQWDRTMLGPRPKPFAVNQNVIECVRETKKVKTFPLVFEKRLDFHQGPFEGADGRNSKRLFLGCQQLLDQRQVVHRSLQTAIAAMAHGQRHIGRPPWRTVDAERSPVTRVQSEGCAPLVVLVTDRDQNFTRKTSPPCTVFSMICLVAKSALRPWFRTFHSFSDWRRSARCGIWLALA